MDKETIDYAISKLTDILNNSVQSNFNEYVQYIIYKEIISTIIPFVLGIISGIIFYYSVKFFIKYVYKNENVIAFIFGIMSIYSGLIGFFCIMGFILQIYSLALIYTNPNFYVIEQLICKIH